MNHLRPLFLRIANSDEQAFNEVFYSYAPRIRQYALHIAKELPVAEEITQDVFLKLWIRRADLHLIDDPAAWLYRITYNLCLNHVRDTVTKTRKIMEWTKLQDGDTAPVEEQLTVKHLTHLLQQGIETLPLQQRRVYIMTYQHNLSRKQIATELAISENTVRNHLSVSVKSLRAYVEHHGEIHLPLLLCSIMSSLL